MNLSKRKTLALFLPAALVLALASLPVDAVSGLLAGPEESHCCDHGLGSVALPEERAPDLPTHDDCPDGCLSCFLPCCAGSVFLRSTSLLPDLPLDSAGSAAPQDNEINRSSRPGDIFHPPRA
ncbi:MAG: hypothetical protein QF492_07775 [Candidatus Krumholzibacteria bacterium]|jgi:hypothetical protein|nr:hypothetical protein [Candidatus Krumholzibacteria bacterium]MDP6669787.1 hypothetical protein [Candidatus Krumholzibacteria bacterium]MDP6796200.1 hypothetical protein [Candidatus Krumholzibacteria bacterium]MDP7021761.1 hypothetical protein [Candidatus Krumholzibacteria bacterium]